MAEEAGARSGRDRADGEAAGLPADGLRQVQVSGTEEAPHEAKLKQKQIQVKEVKFRLGTDEGDYQIKMRNLKRFLEEGDKCEGHLRFPRPRDGAPGVRRAPARARPEADLEALGQVEQMPKLEGRQMIMIIAPKKKK
jgi:translation initiation factor IF-3